MEQRANEIEPGYRRAEKTDIVGTRMCNTVTLNPTEADPREQIYIDIPKLGPETCIVPKTTRLCFTFKNGNTKSTFKNNLNRLLIQRLMVKVGGEIVYDNNGENTLNVYRDLWLSDEKRKNMIEFGIANENTRKILSGDDSADATAKTDGDYDLMMKKVYARQKVKLGKILDDHGLYNMKSDFQYVITLPETDSLMVPQSGEATADYKLTNIHLEYDTIESARMADKVNADYEVGRSLSYEHVTLLKTAIWDKDSVLVNEPINIPRKSMKAIVMLFRELDSKGNEPEDSEDFAYPNVEKVKVTIEGKPNAVYSQGLTLGMFYDEAVKIFGDRENHCNNNLTTRQFYKNKFALVIDLRAVDDDRVVGSRRKLLGIQSGILLEIEKLTNNNSANLKCYTYILSDGLINIAGKQLSSIEY